MLAHKFDIPIFVSTMFLILIGLLAIYSATAQSQSLVIRGNLVRQIIWIGTGLVIGICAIFVSFKFLSRSAYILYFGSVLALLALFAVGHGNGASRWIVLGPMRFQPSEFAKIATVLALAKFLSSVKVDLSRFRDVAICFLIVGVPALLVLRQPDLGTAMVFAGILLPIMYWGGLSTFALFLIVAPFITCIAAFNYYTFFIVIIAIMAILVFAKKGRKVLLFNFLLNVAVGIIAPIAWNRLESYQQSRILTFLGLESDPHGIGYQVIQSKVAMGSGGFLGKGFMEGTQTQLRFLPEQHTDFIFSVIGEEFGFIGAFFVLSLFFIILLRGVAIAAKVRNRFTSLVIIGTVSVIALHVIINIGVTIGIMPVTGLPLPFLSYGDSAMWTFSLFIGLLLNGSIHKLEY